MTTRIHDRSQGLDGVLGDVLRLIDQNPGITLKAIRRAIPALHPTSIGGRMGRLVWGGVITRGQGPSYTITAEGRIWCETHPGADTPAVPPRNLTPPRTYVSTGTYKPAQWGGRV